MEHHSQHQNEVELRRWRDLFDHLPALVAFWDRDLRNVVANTAYRHWFGMDPAEMKGIHIRDVLGEAVYASNLPFITAALGGEEQHFDRTLVTPAGETKHSQAAYIPETLDGVVTGFYVLVTDVTAQVEAGRDLHEAQALARMGSYVFKPRTNQVSFSPELLRIMGLDPDAASPTLEDYLAMVHPDDLEAVRSARDLAERGLEYEARYRIIRGDGEVRAVHSRTRPVQGPEGEVVLLRGVMQDETEVMRVANDLERANTLLMDLLGVLGHDLRQPIGVLNGYLEHLDDEWDHTSEQERRQHVRSALRSAGRLDALLQDILALVNVDTATLTTNPTRIDLPTVITDLTEQLPFTVTVEVEEGLEVFADPVHVRQVLANLLSNCGRYGRPPYLVSAARQLDDVLICVSDHGEGVPPDFVPALFDKFTRAPTGVATTVGGTGFGLYIVRELARANRGDVTYSAGEPHGATFTLRLPGVPAPGPLPGRDLGQSA